MNIPSIQPRHYQTIRFAILVLVCSLSGLCAFAQTSTSATVALSPQPIYQGTTPVATVTVSASDGSSPNASVNCSIVTRGHAAAYAANVVSGTASIALSSIAQVPVGSYSLACTYVGSSTYRASSTPTTPFQVLAATSTTTTTSSPSTQVTQGTTPTVTVSVIASDSSTPSGNVTCIVHARAHGAAYQASLANGTATISLSSLAQVPTGTYPLACSYLGMGKYRGSPAPLLQFQILSK